MQRHSGRLREEVSYEKRTTATLPRRWPDRSTSWNVIYCFHLYGTICVIPYFVLKFFVYHKKPSTHSECRARSSNAWSGHLRKANNILPFCLSHAGSGWLIRLARWNENTIRYRTMQTLRIQLTFCSLGALHDALRETLRLYKHWSRRRKKWRIHEYAGYFLGGPRPPPEVV